MTLRPARAPLLLVLVWAVGVVLATSVGLLAVRLVAEQVGDPAAPALSALTADSTSEPRAALSPDPSGATEPRTAPSAAAPSAAASGSAASAPGEPAGPPASSGPALSPPAPAPAPPGPATVAATFRSAGGTVGMQCTGTTARLLYATPADGYALDEQSVGEAQAEVRFASASDEQRLRMELSCTTGSPRLVDIRVEGVEGKGGDDDDRDGSGKG